MLVFHYSLGTNTVLGLETGEENKQTDSQVAELRLEKRGMSSKTIITCKILEATRCLDEEGTQFTGYEVEIALDNGKNHGDGSNKQVWTIMKRYSQFHDLNQKLAKCGFKKGQLPKLPAKAYGSKNLDEEFIQRRKTLLEQYLNQLMMMKYVAENPGSKRFVIIHKNEDQYASERIQLVVEHPLVREFIRYIPNDRSSMAITLDSENESSGDERTPQSEVIHQGSSGVATLPSNDSKTSAGNNILEDMDRFFPPKKGE